MNMNENSFYDEKELQYLGFKSTGRGVQISKKASFYNANLIVVGANVWIDDFCILSGKIIIGDNVHISASSVLFGGEEGIFIGNYCNISSRCGVYATSDDFTTSKYLGPMCGSNERKMIHGKVVMKDYSAIGTGSTVLTGTTLEDGAVLGAMSFAKNQVLDKWSIYCGIPCKKIKERSN